LYVQSPQQLLPAAQLQDLLYENLKHRDIITGVDFVPIAVKTTGVWGEEALELAKEMGRRISSVNYDLRATD